MGTWKVGDRCYVNTKVCEPAVVKKVGRKYLTVQARRSGTYEFDITGPEPQPRAGYVGWIPVLWTVEEKQREDLRAQCDDLLQRLKGAVRSETQLVRLDQIRQSLLALLPT